MNEQPPLKIGASGLLGRMELIEENEKLRALVFHYAQEAGFTDRSVLATLKEEGIRPPKRKRKKKGA